MTNRVNIKPNRFSMKSRIGAPNFHNRPATIKNRNPRAIIDVAINVPSGMADQPDMIVMILYGNGVSPAINTGQKPRSLNRSLNLMAASSLPKAVRIGSPMLSKANIPIAYPNIPPRTEATMATKAITNARLGRARIIGIINTSGGIGNTLLSIKDTKANTHNARGWSAMDMVQSYKRLIMIALQHRSGVRSTGKGAWRPSLDWIRCFIVTWAKK